MLSTVGKAIRDQKWLVGILCRGFMGMSIAGTIDEKDATMERSSLISAAGRWRVLWLNRLPRKSTSPMARLAVPGFPKDLQALDLAMQVQSLQWVRPMSLPNETQVPSAYPVTR